MRFVSYSKDERNIVESGISEIQKVLMGSDSDKKRRLLFCLDRYMDPYYGYHLPFQEKLTKLLETVVVSPNDNDVIEDALQLLRDYAYGPFEIMEKGVGRIPKELRPEVLEVINLHRICAIEELVNEECKRIFEVERTWAADAYGSFPDEALLIHSQEVTEDLACPYPEKYCDGLFILQNGQIREIGIPAGGLPKQRYPLSGRCFQQVEFYYSIDLINQIVLLICEFGPRWGRCLEYQLLNEGNDTYKLGEAKLKWIS